VTPLQSPDIVYDASQWRAGDIGFSHGTDLIARAIQFAEKREGDPGFYNHTFALLEPTPDGNDWVVIQAQMKGVTDTCKLSDVSPNGSHEVVPFPDKYADRGLFIEFLMAQVGDEYSMLAILSCALDMVLPEKICLRDYATWICSGLIGGGLMYAGHPASKTWGDLYTNTPEFIRKVLVTSEVVL